jgi:hypothetical protein
MPRGVEAELVLVRLRWRTDEAEVVLSLPMSLEKVPSPHTVAKLLKSASHSTVQTLHLHDHSRKCFEGTRDSGSRSMQTIGTVLRHVMITARRYSFSSRRL